MAKRYGDVIDLSLGDSDIPCSKEVIDGMYKDTLAGHTKYTAHLGDIELREEICKMYKTDHGCDFSVDNIMVTSGGTHGMYLLMETILDEGDEVIVISPYYVYYRAQIELPRGKLVVYNTSKEDNFEINLDLLEKVITSRTKAIIINSPNNPTGRVYHEKTIIGLIDLSYKYNFLIIADDIYTGLNFTARKKPICAYSPRSPRIVTVSSFSKDYSMTGFRLGYIVGENRLIDCIKNVNESISFTVNSMAQRAGIHTLRNRKAIRNRLIDEYKERVTYVYERIKSLKNISCNISEGTFYLFVDISTTGLTSEKVCEKILDDARVLVIPGSSFGEAGEGFIRVACTSEIDVLKEAFDRIEKMGIFR